jgi:hypothetical protein
MTLPQILFAIRLLSALLLFGFLGLIAYYLYRDALSVRVRTEAGRQLGTLRVIRNQGAEPAANTGYPLGPVCTIGRSVRNTIVLDDSYVSQEHARIVRRDGHWWLNDLGSRNGTLLNEVPVSAETVVTTGDVITVGQVAFVLESADEAV